MKKNSAIDPILCLTGWICSILLVGILYGCTHPTAIERPSMTGTVPETWTAPLAVESTQPTVKNFLLFDDPGLMRLIQEALVRNYDLRLAAARIDSLRAEARLAGAQRMPAFNAGAAWRKGEAPVQVLDQVSTEGSKRMDLSLTMSWELDVWGRLKDRTAAALHEVQAVEADWQAARLSLAGQVAKIWYQVIADRLQLHLVQTTLESYKVSARIVRRHFESGISGALDLRLALSNVASAEDLLQVRKDQFSQSKRRLQRLLQRYPDGELETHDTLPPIGRCIPAGLPSQLLARRPDILAAKQRLLAADLRISEAQKDFLPDIRLTGDAGSTSKRLKHLVNTDYLFWNLITNLTQPLYAGGRLQANLALARNAAECAWLHYGNTVLTAFQEVEQTLTTEHHLIQRIAAVHRTINQAVGAETLALKGYAAGVTDIVTVLESQRRVLDSKVDLIEVQRRQLQNRVDIYLALGGGLDAELEIK